MKNNSQIFIAVGLLLLAKSYHKRPSIGKVIKHVSNLPQGYTKVGRIKSTIAKKAHIQCADIVISKERIEHIEKRHSKELETLGVTAEEFVREIASYYTQIRVGTKDSILLVVSTPFTKDKVLAIRLNLTIHNDIPYWLVATAFPADHFNKDRVILWSSR